MKKLILLKLLFFLFFTSPNISICSQDNYGLLKSDPIITYWSKEKINKRSIGRYKSYGTERIGSKIGTWRYFYPNGKPQEISNYFEGTLNGKYLSYYANGNTKIKGYFTLGAADSTFEAYYYNGQIAEKGSYLVQPKVKNYDTNALNRYIENVEIITSIKTGNWIYFYENGRIMEESYFKDSDTTEYIKNYFDLNGTKLVSDGNGSLKSYYPSGKIKAIENISNGIKNGPYIIYKPNGEIRKKGYYSNGKMDSLWTEKFITNDKLYQKTSYRNGKKDGVFKEYTSEGNLLIDGKYLNGEKNGDWTYYYANKNVDMTGGFKKDLQHGYWKFYYPKGIIYYEGEFINNKKNGVWKFYYNNGNVWRTGIYKNDQKNGKWTTLYEDGEKSMEGTFKQDLENGMWKSWYENGQLKDEGYFNMGSMDANWKGYYKNGQIKYQGQYEDNYKSGKWIYWSSKGVLIEERNYLVKDNRSLLIPDENRIVRKSINDGKWIKYSEFDGSLKSEENFKDGKLNGVSNYFYPGGIIKSSIVNYKDGLLDGTYKSFGRKGNLTSETNYKDNKKHGDMKIYSKRGKLISHIVYKEGVKSKDIIKKITFKYSAPKNKK